MAIWLCPECGTVCIRSGLFVQIELVYEDAIQIFPQIAQKLIEIYVAGGPPEPTHDYQHLEPEDLGDEEDEGDSVGEDGD